MTEMFRLPKMAVKLGTTLPPIFQTCQKTPGFIILKRALSQKERLMRFSTDTTREIITLTFTKPKISVKLGRRFQLLILKDLQETYRKISRMKNYFSWEQKKVYTSPSTAEKTGRISPTTCRMSRFITLIYTQKQTIWWWQHTVVELLFWMTFRF